MTSDKLDAVMSILALILFVILALYDLRLAALAILLWLLLSMFLSRDNVYTGRKALIKTRRAVYATFSGSADLRKTLLHVSRGMRILGGRIEPSQLVELAINVSRKKARYRGRRKMHGASITVDYILPRERYFKLHFPATLRRSAILGEFPKVSWDSVRARLLTGKSKVSLVLILDSSASMMYSVRGILTALKAIEREARRYRDRVALVVCKGFGAVVAQYPTTNFNLMLGKISRVGLDDFTPLASGMYLGLNLALTERRRGYEPVVVIVSDGNANIPLEKHRRGYRRFAFDPAVQSVLEVATQISKSGIETVVVNTKHREPSVEAGDVVMSGTELLVNVAKATKGSYVGIIS
ncbi:MAG: VWA domain-containing protein [Thermofilaceae archaeon]|nr:VWA domain-containing protein [Thermofilaceae archaeon]